MANWQLNKIIKKRQTRVLASLACVLISIVAMVMVLLLDAHPKKTNSKDKPLDITGIVDESFTAAINDHALVSQQTELASLKNQIEELANTLKTMNETHQKELEVQKEEFKVQLTTLKASVLNKTPDPLTSDIQNPELWHHPNTYAMNNQIKGSLSDASIHSVSFRKKRQRRHFNNNYLNPEHYVPSNTSVRAIVLGGADADASVNGQSKNNGVMLFKFLEDGTLPNGQHSHLKGCRVSANSYGDISSERAFATLYRISCAHRGKPIIDKEVTGWVFFNGKVGIKGIPLMRDNKVMTWAGVSGALSGIAQAAQYAQSVQSIGPYGATSVVPSNQIAPYAAYGGAAKAADTLSQYYVKRAEQYHPVIQVGSGNVVTIVFKDGFYLEPDEQQKRYALNQRKEELESRELFAASGQEPNQMNFTVPPEVLGSIDRAGTLNRNRVGV